MKKYFFIIIVATLLSICHTGCESTETETETETEPEQTEQEYEFNFQLEKDRIIIYATINGLDSSKFMFDNGYTTTSFTSQRWEMMNRNAQSKPEFIRSYPDYNLSHYLFPTEIKVGNYTYSIDTVMAETQPYLCGTGVSDLQGAIGVELFMNNIVQIDFVKNKITLKQNLPEDIGSYEQYDMRSFSKKDEPWFYKFRFLTLDGFYDLSGNPITANMLVDLGSVSNNIDYPFYEHINTDLISKNIDTNSLTYRLLFTTYSVIESKYGAARGGIHIDDVRDGVIGISFWKHHNVIFDYPHNKLYIKPVAVEKTSSENNKPIIK